MDDTARYAIYFAPEPTSSLWTFGSSVLGYDAVTGENVPFAERLPLDGDRWRALTAEPRLYGFHATLKAPFHVHPGVTEADVVTRLQDIAARHGPFSLGHLKVALMGWFVALVPGAVSPALHALERENVERLSELVGMDAAAVTAETWPD